MNAPTPSGGRGRPYEERNRRRSDTSPASTISVKRLTKRERREIVEGARDYPEGVERPKTRADCARVERPCPFVSCRYHNFLDVSPKTGSIKLNFPDREPWEIEPGWSCCLDVADAGGATLEEVGDTMNITRERIRQIEVRGLDTLEKRIRAGAPGLLEEIRSVSAKRRTP